MKKSKARIFIIKQINEDFRVWRSYVEYKILTQVRKEWRIASNQLTDEKNYVYKWMK